MDEKLITIENQGMVLGKPFTPVTLEPKQEFKTDFMYWKNHQKRLIGRFKDRQFQFWNKDTGSWENANYRDFEYTAEVDGKEVKKNYFRRYDSYIVDFGEEVEFQDVWNPNSRTKETMKLKRVALWLTKMPSDELKKVMESDEKRGEGTVKKSMYVIRKEGEGLRTKYFAQFEKPRDTPLNSGGDSSPSSSSSSSETVETVEESPKVDYEQEVETTEGDKIPLSEVIKEMEGAGYTKEMAKSAFEVNYKIDIELLEAVLEDKFE